MTTTSTFQGMESGSKPSSRVLAPPGGGSSNIFGFGDDAPNRNAQKTQINDASPGKKRNPDNVNFGTHDVLNQGPPESQPNAKPKAPQAGEAGNSFSNLFGDGDGSGEGRDQQHRHVRSLNFSLGEEIEHSSPRHQTRSAPRNVNSFSNVLNIDETLMSPSSKLGGTANSVVSPNITQSVSSVSEQVYTEKGSLNDFTSSLNNLSLDEGEDCHDINSSFSRVLGQYGASRTPKANKSTNRGAFNPITGEPYPDKSDNGAEAQQEEDKKVEEEKAKEQEKDAQAAQPQKKHPSDSSGIFGGAPVQTTTRVTQPPGGRSTKLW